MRDAGDATQKQTEKKQSEGLSTDAEYLRSICGWCYMAKPGNFLRASSRTLADSLHL